MSDRLEIRAHAKVNLVLSVAPPEQHGTRAGWHRIASWMSAIELHDDVELTMLPPDATSRAGVSWATDAPRPTTIDWPIAADLAVRAHWLLEEHCDTKLPCEILVRKRVPVGGGLGGGSSDAAAALIGLNRLFRLGLAPVELRELSVSLGSDVAFFIDDGENDEDVPRPAIVEGFGDLIERRGRVGGGLTLLVPPFGCNTREVYAKFDRTLPDGHALRDQHVRHVARSSELAGSIAPAELFNDLIGPADAVGEGKLIAAARALEMAGAGPVCMSGSGSTMFCFGEVLPEHIPAGWTACATRLA